MTIKINLKGENGLVYQIRLSFVLGNTLDGKFLTHLTQHTWEYNCGQQCLHPKTVME